MKIKSMNRMQYFARFWNFFVFPISAFAAVFAFSLLSDTDEFEGIIGILFVASLLMAQALKSFLFLKGLMRSSANLSLAIFLVVVLTFFYLSDFSDLSVDIVVLAIFALYSIVDYFLTSFLSERANAH